MNLSASLRLWARTPLLTLVAGGLFAVSVASAQPIPSLAKEETITLSPFEVSVDKDQGYPQANLSLGYALTLRHRPIDLQLNLTNLLNYSDPVFTGTATYQGAAVRTALNYLDARKAMLTATHRF